MKASHRWNGFNSWLPRVSVTPTVNLPAMQQTPVQSLGRKDPLEKGLTTHSSILAWRIPGTAEPVGLQSMGSQRVRHDWAANIFTVTPTVSLSPQSEVICGSSGVQEEEVEAELRSSLETPQNHLPKCRQSVATEPLIPQIPGQGADSPASLWKEFQRIRGSYYSSST